MNESEYNSSPFAKSSDTDDHNGSELTNLAVVTSLGEEPHTVLVGTDAYPIRNEDGGGVICILLKLTLSSLLLTE